MATNNELIRFASYGDILILGFVGSREIARWESPHSNFNHRLLVLIYPFEVQSAHSLSQIPLEALSFEASDFISLVMLLIVPNLSRSLALVVPMDS